MKPAASPSSRCNDGTLAAAPPDIWFVYLLECADNALYCGVTNNLQRRLARHNSGRASRCTTARLPVLLKAAGVFFGKSPALKAEVLVKKTPRNQKIATLVRLCVESCKDKT